METLGFPKPQEPQEPQGPVGSIRQGDPVQCIPRCGPVKSQRLAEVGVLTVHDLLCYKGPAPQGVNLAQLKSTAEQLLTHKIAAPTVATKGPHTSQHSWYGMTVHAIVSKSIRRVIIQDLVVLDHAILLSVCWYAKGSWHSKMVSPMAILALHNLWKQHYVVSSSDGEYNVTTNYHSDDVEIREPLQVNDEQWVLSKDQQRALKFTLRELKSVQSFSVLALLT